MDIAGVLLFYFKGTVSVRKGLKTTYGAYFCFIFTRI